MTKLGQRNYKVNAISDRLQDVQAHLNVLDGIEVPELYLLQENKIVMETKHQVGCLITYLLRSFLSRKILYYM